MLWKTIKKILQKQGGKCIIIEENEPTYLVMKIDDEVEEVNKDINEWKEKEDKQIEVPETETDNQAVKVEDLPF
ncbi:MAG: hypothetical protein HQ537_00205 [Parcubacteria group bacterium]|nr:hypothetical protein [Parcubacteria group bacterium]